MANSVRFHPKATAEATHAAEWYRERSENAAEGFEKQVTEALARVIQDPMRRPEWMHGARRALLVTYPFSIVYVVRENAIDVIAVASQRRKPGYWTKRMAWSKAKSTTS